MGSKTLRAAVRKGREAFRRAFPQFALGIQRRIPGQFQPHNYTTPDRYPWLFEFASAHLSQNGRSRILSFGCSRGDEVFTLRQHFPRATLKGIDVNPGNIAYCLERMSTQPLADVAFETAATTENEATGAYDAIFCLAVLCLSDLTELGVERCDPFLRFEDFERTVTDFARCLKPGGLLLLHTTNFRFCDTAIADEFDIALEAEPSQLAPAVKFDRNNRLMRGERYRAVAFRKRMPTS